MITDGLINRWELVDDAIDSVGADDATIYNAPPFVDGALSCDGVNQYLAIPIPGLYLNTTVSLTFWLYWISGDIPTRNNTSSGGTIPVYSSAGKLRMRAQGLDSVLGQSVDLYKNRWVNFVLKSNGSVAKLYADASPALSVTAGSGSVISPMYFGKAGAASTYSTIKCRDVRRYSRELTDDEIADIAAGVG
ncbi:LamG-like jellyroll fold domain-containing protein [Thiocystis violascens]|uniref:LamG-like jellyroll fold domain-containing protein n=1 Tax=Thiocystis violascens TaxID=73141 RepID=UPI0012F629E2|nr:LamG-like jellyroll fold domain-containing protein [Thiocystis violascens]